MPMEKPVWIYQGENDPLFGKRTAAHKSFSFWKLFSMDFNIKNTNYKRQAKRRRHKKNHQQQQQGWSETVEKFEWVFGQTNQRASEQMKEQTSDDQKKKKKTR